MCGVPRSVQSNSAATAARSYETWERIAEMSASAIPASTSIRAPPVQIASVSSVPIPGQRGSASGTGEDEGAVITSGVATDPSDDVAAGLALGLSVGLGTTSVGWLGPHELAISRSAAIAQVCLTSG